MTTTWVIRSSHHGRSKDAWEVNVRIGMVRFNPRAIWLWPSRTALAHPNRAGRCGLARHWSLMGHSPPKSALMVRSYKRGEATGSTAVGQRRPSALTTGVTAQRHPTGNGMPNQGEFNTKPAAVVGRCCAHNNTVNAPCEWATTTIGRPG